MRILIRHENSLYKFVVVKSSDRDGSLSLIIRRDGHSSSCVIWGNKQEEQEPQCIDFEKPKPKNKRITIHQSGRINYHEKGCSIFIEPLTRTTMVNCIYAYRIPAIQKLDAFLEPIDAEDSIFDLTGLGNTPVSFSFFIGPAFFTHQGKAVKISYEMEGYALIVSVDDQTFSVAEGYEEYFTTLSPKYGPFHEQQIVEDQAMVYYHQAITGSTEPILYAPNGEGVIRLIFAVPMRIAPAFKIELEDPGLHVTDQDLEREERSDKVMLKFKVRHRKTKQIIREPVAIRSIELDAEL